MGIKRIVKRSTDANKTLISVAFDEFIQEKEQINSSPATIKNYQVSYKYWMEFNEFDDESTTDMINSGSIYHWLNTMNLEGKRITTINHYCRDLRVFLYWCMEEDRGYIKKPFKIQQLKGQEPQLKFFSDEELDLLLKRPDKEDSFRVWRTWVAINWVLATGNRASTICEVQISDINFTKKEISLRHTKNKKAQTIPLSPALETILKEYIKTWRAGASSNSWLFPNVGDEKLTTNALSQGLEYFCKKRGVTHYNIHGLRHNFAREAIKNGLSVVVLQNVLGHSTINMTQHYVKLLVEDFRDDFERFNPLDNIKKKGKRTAVVKKN